MKKLPMVGLAAGILALSGCSGTNLLDSMNIFASARPGAKPADLVNFLPSLTPLTTWKQDVGKSGLYVLRPAVVDGVVFAAAADGTVSRIEQGKVVWKANPSRSLSAGVGADARLVAVGTPDGRVIVLDALSGHKKWEAQVSTEILAAPALTASTVVVRAGDNRIFAFSSEDGSRLWSYQRPNPPLAIRSVGSPVISESYVFAGFPGGKLVALGMRNGAQLWEGTVAQPKGTTELDRMSDVVGEPVIGTSEVCAAAFQGKIACFDLGSGNTRWSRDFSAVGGLTLDNWGVYATDERGVVHAFDRATGRNLWRQDKLLHRQVTAPLARRGLVAVADGQGYVHWMGRDDGSFLARVATDGSASQVQPVGLGTGVLIQTRQGGLFALDAQ